MNVLQSYWNFIISTGHWRNIERRNKHIFYPKHTEQKVTYRDACHVHQRQDKPWIYPQIYQGETEALWQTIQKKKGIENEQHSIAARWLYMSMNWTGLPSREAERLIWVQIMGGSLQSNKELKNCPKARTRNEDCMFVRKMIVTLFFTLVVDMRRYIEWKKIIKWETGKARNHSHSRHLQCRQGRARSLADDRFLGRPGSLADD